MKSFRLPAFAALLLTAPLAAQDDPGAQMSFMRELAGDAGRVKLSVDKMPDGTGGVRISSDPETGERMFVARGPLVLDSDRLYLESRSLDYRSGAGQLVAEEDIVLRTEGLEATAQSLVYGFETGGAVLEGSPSVKQESPENRIAFDGMRRFEVKQTPDGGRELLLTGPNPIVVQVQDKTPEAATTGGPGTPAGGGAFSGFGNNVTITASPYRDLSPQVTATLMEQGDLQTFRAVGAVQLESPDFRLRADELIYNAETGKFEANGGVYLRQSQVEADAGRMIYDLETGQVTLSVQPTAKLYEEDGSGFAQFSNAEIITYTASTTGAPEIDMKPKGNVEYITLTPEQRGTSGDSAPQPGEIIVP